MASKRCWMYWPAIFRPLEPVLRPSIWSLDRVLATSAKQAASSKVSWLSTVCLGGQAVSSRIRGRDMGTPGRLGELSGQGRRVWPLRPRVRDRSGPIRRDDGRKLAYDASVPPCPEGPMTWTPHSRRALRSSLALLVLAVLVACPAKDEDTGADGTSDGGTVDGGSSDGGTADGGSSDGGTADGGSSDGGTADGGSSDGGAGETDADEDGWPESEDCDDSDPDVHPGAEEQCNGIDDDCDGELDPESLMVLRYQDVDATATATRAAAAWPAPTPTAGSRTTATATTAMPRQTSCCRTVRPPSAQGTARPGCSRPAPCPPSSTPGTTRASPCPRTPCSPCAAAATP